VTWAHNGGRGAYLCDGCGAMICEDIGVYAPLDDARTVHRPDAVVRVDRDQMLCAHCAPKRASPMDRYAPVFSPLRARLGREITGSSLALALGIVGAVPYWLSAARQYRPCGWLAFCERLRDDHAVRDQVDAACRLGGYFAALPLLTEFEKEKSS
jgi:hypothetical protein